MTVNLYFMRHGQTYLNKYERMQGWSNAPLTPEGEQGCIASGRGLANIRFDAVYTSDLQRTQDTANLVLEQNKATKSYELIVKPEFREIFFGSFEGLDVNTVWPPILDKAGSGIEDPEKVLNTLHHEDITHDAENYIAFWERVEKGILDVLKGHKGTNRNILIVSHGLTIQFMLRALIPDFQIGAHLENASVSKIRYQNGQFHLESVNDVSHFVRM